MTHCSYFGPSKCIVECDQFHIPTCDRQKPYVSPVLIVRPDPYVSTVPGRRLWCLDSDTEIDLDQIQTKTPSPELGS